MKLTLEIKEPGLAVLELKEGARTIGHKSLTISQGFDNMLIASIDKLVEGIKMDRLSIKSLEIRGKMNPEAVSSMTLKAISSALEV